MLNQNRFIINAYKNSHKRENHMKYLLSILFSISIVLASDTYPININDMFKYYQHKHQIYSLEDLERSKFKTSSRPPRSNRERDPSDLIGNWEQKKMEMGMYITVDTDQTAPTMGSMSAMDPAEGGIIISNDEFTTELNYLSFGDLFDFRQRDRDADALQHAQDYVDSAATLQGQSPFDLMLEFELAISDTNSNVVTGGLGGDDPGNCDINWPEDPYHMAVYSFVSEYVLMEGASIGCFLDDSDLDLTYGYVAEEIESSWDGDGGGNDDDDSTSSEGMVFMNFDIFSLFAIMFGLDVGIENPMIMTLDSGYVMAADLSDTTGGYYGGQYMAMIDTNQVSIDLENYEFIFADLTMESYYGTSSINVNGTIGAVMYELEAGVETEIPLPSMLLDSAFNDAGEAYLSLYEDGSGMTINVEEDGYYGTMVDTSFFTWNATEDSVYILSYDDDYDSTVVDVMVYYFNDDTLEIVQSIDPCEDGGYYYYYDSYDDCFEYGEWGNYAFGVSGIQDFHQDVISYFVPYDMVSTSDINPMPLDHKLYPAYPNPFNPVITLSYYLASDGFVNITIYDMMGRKINILENGPQTAGHAEVQWNAMNDRGQAVSAGVYLYKIQVGDKMDTRKIVLLK